MAGDRLTKIRPGVVAVTGSLGSGKSSVARFLARITAGRHIDADQVCRDLMTPQAKGWRAFARTFGPGYFLKDLSVDRPKLRRAIFRNDEMRARLNRLLHPLAREVIWREVGKEQAAGPGSLIVVEVPLLFETGWNKDFDEIVVVFADERICFERSGRRDGVSLQEIAATFKAQWPLADKVMGGRYVIDNSSNWGNTLLQLQRLARLLVKSLP